VHRRPWLRPGPALAVLMFVVLAGVLGMHGLDAHGVTREAAPVAGSGRTEVSGHPGHGSQAGRHAQSVTPDLLTLGPVPDGRAHAREHESPGAHDALTALAMCLVVLASALAGIGHFLRRHHGTGWLMPRLVRFTRAPTAARRDRDPPSLAQLSILRC
jgi:hypothetical protein